MSPEAAVPSLADFCAVAIAECFRGDGEILANPIGTLPMVGGRLARASFEPDLMMTDGEALLIANDEAVPAPDDKIVEYWNPYRSMFDIVWSGRRHVIMGASQIDRFGNQNFAFIGEWEQPRTQLLGFRGAPGNTIQNKTSYWIPAHSPRVFVGEVSVVSGVGYDRAAALGRAGRYHDVHHVVTNLGVLDFETPDHSMRLHSVHPGVTVDQVVEATGFELTLPSEVPETRQPTAEELSLLYEVIDPENTRERVAGVMTSLRTASCDLFGVDVPIVQTGMGWVAGARLTSATSAAGALGILASATMTYDELVEAIHEVKERTDRPFGVNLRSDQPDVDDRIALLVREDVRVASFAQAPGERLVKVLKDAGVVVMPTVGARRHAEKVAEWGVDAVIAQGAEGGGHTGTVPTSLLLPQVCEAVDIPVMGAGGFHSGQGLVAALAWGAAGVAMGTRFLLSAESTVPDDVKRRYLQAAVTDTVVTKQVDGHPQRVIRTDLVEHLEGAGRVTALPRSLANALKFRKLTGRSMESLAREGLAMRKSQELTWAQVAMAANAPMLTKAALVDGNLQAGVLPTGQVVGVIDSLPTVAEIIRAIMEEAETTLARLAALQTREGT